MTTSISIKKVLVGVAASVLLLSPMFALADSHPVSGMSNEEIQRELKAIQGKLTDGSVSLGTLEHNNLIKRRGQLKWELQKRRNQEAAAKAARKKREAAASALMVRIKKNMQCMTKTAADAARAVDALFGFGGANQGAANRSCQAVLGALTNALKKHKGFVLQGNGGQSNGGQIITSLTFDQCSQESKDTKRVVSGNIIWTDPETGRERNLGPAVCNSATGQYVAAGVDRIQCSVVPPLDALRNDVTYNRDGVRYASGCSRTSPTSGWALISGSAVWQGTSETPPPRIDFTDFGTGDSPKPASPDVRTPSTPTRLKSTAAPQKSFLGSLLKALGR